MGAALPLVRSLYTWSMHSEMWLYALLNNSVLKVGELQDSCHQQDAMGEPVPPLLYIVESISCVFGIFTGFLSLLFCLGELDLDIIKPKQRVVSVLARVKLIRKTCRSMAFIFGVIRSISALSFAMDASNSPSTSLEGFCVDARAAT